MSAAPPLFLTIDLVIETHQRLISAYGGSTGIRDRGLIESAIAQGENAFHYGSVDLFGIAATYAYHLAESQAFIDGN